MSTDQKPELKLTPMQRVLLETYCDREFAYLLNEAAFDSIEKIKADNLFQSDGLLPFVFEELGEASDAEDMETSANRVMKMIDDLQEVADALYRHSQEEAPQP